MVQISRKEPYNVPKSSSTQAQARRDEIVDACAALYETMCFRDITLKEIGQRTSFTRTSIYNYFQSREEIFLALAQREYEAWAADLEALRAGHDSLDRAAFASALAHTLERRTRLLKLMAMNLYDMEDNARMENLVAFKKAYSAAVAALARCVEKFFPQLAGGGAWDFVYLFLPFMFGIYPYTSATDKQREAMRLAQVSYPALSVYELARSFIETLLPAVG